MGGTGALGGATGRALAGGAAGTGPVGGGTGGSGGSGGSGGRADGIDVAGGTIGRGGTMGAATGAEGAACVGAAAGGRMNGGGTAGRAGVCAVCAGIPVTDGRRNGVGVPVVGVPAGKPEGRGGNAGELMGVGMPGPDIAAAAGAAGTAAAGVGIAGRGGRGAGRGGTAIGPGADGVGADIGLGTDGAACSGITGVGAVPRLRVGMRSVDDGVNSSAASPGPSFDIVITPPQTAHRARTIGPAIFAGSIRNTERHSGQATFTGPPSQTRRSAPGPARWPRERRCDDRSRTPIPAASSRSSSFP